MHPANFYCQLDYEHVAYPSEVNPKGNIANNGCGVCCTCMVLESLLGIPFSIEEGAKFALECGARAPVGTNYYILAEEMTKRFPLDCIVTEDMEEVAAFLREKKGLVVANTYGDRPDYIGVFSDGGHYVVAAALEGDQLAVWDPMYKEGSGRYDKPGRAGKVRMDDKTAWADYHILGLDCRERPYFLFSLRK